MASFTRVRPLMVLGILLLLLGGILACAQGEPAKEGAATPAPAAAPAPSTTPAAAPAPAPPAAVVRPAPAGPNAFAWQFPLRADRPRLTAGQEGEKGAQLMVQYGMDKLPIWTKANYGGQAVFSGGVFPANLDPFKVLSGQRSTFGGTLMTFDNGRCSRQGKADMTTCDGTRAEIYVAVLLPGVFERWEQPTALSYLFHINKSAVWPAIPPMNRTDRAVTAEDVVWFMQTQKNGGIMSGSFSLTDTIEAVDRSTVKVTMKEVDADFIRAMASASLAIVPKECYDLKGCLAEKFISPGPYLLRQFELRGPSLFERNPEYHVKGVPWLDSFRTTYIPDLAAQKAAFLTGKIDFYRAFRPSELQGIQKERPGVQALAAISLNGLLHYRVQLKGPMADVRVRKALALGVDWPTAWEVFNEGFTVAATEVSYEHLGLQMPVSLKDACEYYCFDLAKAKKLLADAGYPDGFEITMQTTGPSGAWYEINLAVQDQWLRNLGVKAKLFQVDSVAHGSSLRERTWRDLWYTVCYVGCAAPDATGPLLQHVSWSPQNYSGVNDPKVDDLFARIRRELDPVKRKDLLWEYQRYMWEMVYTFSMGNPLGFEIMQPWELNATFHSQLWLGGVNGSTWTHMFDLSKLPSR